MWLISSCTAAPERHLLMVPRWGWTRIRVICKSDGKRSVVGGGENLSIDGFADPRARSQETLPSFQSEWVNHTLGTVRFTGRMLCVGLIYHIRMEQETKASWLGRKLWLYSDTQTDTLTHTHTHFHAHTVTNFNVMNEWMYKCKMALYTTGMKYDWNKKE